MASWKCGIYVVVGTIGIILIILLNFDFLPKRRLSEELELTTKSSFKGSTTWKGVPSTVKVPTDKAARVRILTFNAKCIYFLRNYTESFICMITPKLPIFKTRKICTCPKYLQNIWFTHANLYVGCLAYTIMMEQDKWVVHILIIKQTRVLEQVKVLDLRKTLESQKLSSYLVIIFKGGKQPDGINQRKLK